MFLFFFLLTIKNVFFPFFVSDLSRVIKQEKKEILFSEEEKKQAAAKMRLESELGLGLLVFVSFVIVARSIEAPNGK